MQNSIAPVGLDYKWIDTTYIREFMPNATLEGMEYSYENLTMDFNEICANYSVAEGSDSCFYDRENSFFTVLAPYLGFIKKTLNRDIKTDDSFFNVTVDSFDPDYKMTDANAVSSDMALEAKLVTGDLFAKVDAPDGPPVESNGNDDTSNSIVSDDGGSSNDGGLSKKNSIIIAVCVTVGGVAIIVITSLLLWRRYLRKKRAVDLMRERQYQEAMSVEIGGTTVPALSSRGQQLPASTETNAEEDAILESRYASQPDRSNDIEVHHADLPPMYEEAVKPPPAAD
ncbi:hypothetical protein EV183_003287, partial [Coemansia sp. RSA 2336]